ncbi:putative restriction endonuclease [Pseudomonas helmanticensis]|uniref:Restriction endonuclease n=1 Tax=Pseudomonas helmanticensis TaxID=1471381 RepID=A0ACD2UDW6_9PSED|nr:HNH endonuclease [Pseudomonas helmanticensis]SMQ30705.1 putative restriction endonuclease [Pseudomonas helmanticensis]
MKDLIGFEREVEWDRPFFKVLRKNETGEGEGNQSGFVVPVSLRQYLPFIIGEPTSEMPTVGMRLDVSLYLKGELITSVSTRYQLQSWRGSNKRETRVTGKLTSLLDDAKENDLLVVSRRRSAINCYRFNLIPESSAEFSLYIGLVKGRRWGSLWEFEAPESFYEELEVAEEKEEVRESLPFSLFDFDREKTTTVVQKRARSQVFKRRVIAAYNYKCAVCAGGLKSPGGFYELEAAHVVPHSAAGADDVRNGLALCRSHHWAFDKGLFGVNSNRELFVPDLVMAMPENNDLVGYHGKPLYGPESEDLQVDLSAFNWHWDNAFIGC